MHAPAAADGMQHKMLAACTCDRQSFRELESNASNHYKTDNLNRIEWVEAYNFHWSRCFEEPDSFFCRVLEQEEINFTTSNHSVKSICGNKEIKKAHLCYKSRTL